MGIWGTPETWTRRLENEFLDAANQAAGFEVSGRSDEAGKVWDRTADLKNRIITNNPDRAFNLGIRLTMSNLPIDIVDDSDDSKIRMWNLGTGLDLVADKRLSSQFKDFIEKSEGSKLLDILNSCVNFELKVPDDFYGLSDHPECYATAISMLIVLQNEQQGIIEVDRLAQTARLRLREPEIIKLIDHYSKISDTQKLAVRLQGYSS